jgi:hypothetical protein
MSKLPPITGSGHLRAGVTTPTPKRSPPKLAMDLVGPDTPLRLETAVNLAFPDGGMTVSGLRREADKHRLVIETIAGKQFTTLNNIKAMREQCRDNQKGQGFGLSRSGKKTGSSANGQHGSSVMERAKSARASLENSARMLSERSPTISPQNTSPQNSATVTRLKR